MQRITFLLFWRFLLGLAFKIRFKTVFFLSQNNSLHLGQEQPSICTDGVHLCCPSLSSRPGDTSLTFTITYLFAELEYGFVDYCHFLPNSGLLGVYCWTRLCFFGHDWAQETDSLEGSECWDLWWALQCIMGHRDHVNGANSRTYKVSSGNWSILVSLMGCHYNGWHYNGKPPLMEDHYQNRPIWFQMHIEHKGKFTDNCLEEYAQNWGRRKFFGEGRARLSAGQGRW